MKLLRLVLWLSCSAAPLVRGSPSSSIARVWDLQIISAIRIDLPNPPVHARNLFHLSVAMYDAWAAYDPGAVGYLYHGKHTATNTATARREAISYAAYRMLVERYTLSRNSATTLTALAVQMSALGYDTNNNSLDPSTAAGVGNRVAAAVSSYFLNDGALQTRGYLDLPPDQGGYTSTNPTLDTGSSGTPTDTDPNRWQSLTITNAVSQNGIPIATTQKFVGSQWLGVRPFALTRRDRTQPWIDPGPPPHLGGVGDAQYRTEAVDVIRRSSQLTPDDGATLDISPGAFGNNSLGANDGSGHPLNPATGQAYAANVVKRGDFARVLAEFWADGPNSETPPGHWNVIANNVTDSPAFVRKLGGVGSVLDDLEWDVKLYFVLNAAVHEAACAAWSLKRTYDGWRPIEAIRYMGQLGQSSDPNLPSHHAYGLPLAPGVVELVTPATAQPGGRHAGLPVNAVVILAWPGPPADPTNQHSGVRWMLPANWLPYQKRTFVTPAFPGYISGHSTFSRAGAEVLAAITGSPFFPGGLATYTATSLAFENGPSKPVQLQWGTYFDASDQAGISRLFGGIHVSVDDLTGRRAGAQCGQGAWALARLYFDGTVTQSPLALDIQPFNSSECQLTYSTLRGFFYKLQSTSDLGQPFIDDPSGSIQALDTSMIRLDATSNVKKFYRILRSLAP